MFPNHEQPTREAFEAIPRSPLLTGGYLIDNYYFGDAFWPQRREGGIHPLGGRPTNDADLDVDLTQ